MMVYELSGLWKCEIPWMTRKKSVFPVTETLSSPG